MAKPARLGYGRRPSGASWPRVNWKPWRYRLKIVRWPVAAATAYVIYKYTIGKKAKGQAVFTEPSEEATPETQREGSSARPKAKRKPKA